MSFDGTVTCDKCKEDFSIVPQSEKLTDGGERIYFTCPHCEAEYLTALFSARGVELREKIQVLMPDIRQVMKAKGRIPNYLRQRLEKLQSQLETEVVGRGETTLA